MTEFKPRLEKPENGNPYYNTKSNGGYSTAIKGNPTDAGCNVLSNCVGYAFGRFNEIAGNTEMSYLQPRNAENFFAIAKEQGLETGTEPRVGAIMCWAKGKAGDQYNDGAGHVAVVEEVVSPLKVRTSESGYNCKNPFWIQARAKGDGNWGAGNGYTFLGFIYNPALKEEQKPFSVIREGDKGDNVKELQTVLAKLGFYYNADIDGSFGRRTLSAVLGFQFKNGLEVDGVVGEQTAKALGIRKDDA